MNSYQKIEATEVKFHAAVRRLFNFIILVHSWITSPITTFKIVFLKMEWIPVKEYKGLFMKEEGGVVRVRFKKQPGEFRFAATRTDLEKIAEEIADYFGLE